VSKSQPLLPAGQEPAFVNKGRKIMVVMMMMMVMMMMTMIRGRTNS
jgi:hypothetical protein